MSERNKKFRSHCNIDVALDKENSCVSVNVSYKPELLEPPHCFNRNRYDYRDVIEELERQGITIATALSGHCSVLDNTIPAAIEIEPCFSLISKAKATSEPEPEPEPELKKAAKKGRSRTKTKVME